MKRTTFYDVYSRDAVLTEFAGFELPLRFSSIREEHMAVRDAVGLFDVSHMGRVFVRGEDAEAYLNYLTVNDVSRLEDQKAQYTMFCNKGGGVLDDFIAYRFDENTYLLVYNASNRQSDLEWILKHREKFDVTVDVVSDDTGMVAVQGPLAGNCLSSIFSEISSLGGFRFVDAGFDGSRVMISRTGYTGEDGFEVILWLGQEDVQLSLWRTIMDNMEVLDGLPCGLGARDTLRIEAGYCLYGNDLTEEITPWEAGLGWVVKLEQGGFIGKDALERKKGEEGRIRRGVVLEEGIPRHGHRVLSESDEEIGVVTSGTFSPLLQEGIGFVYVDTEYTADGETVYVDVRGKKSQGRITGFPFYDTDVYGASRKN